MNTQLKKTLFAVVVFLFVLIISFPNLASAQALTPTLTLTQTITPTPSITVSPSPTITVTPSITATPTITTTPTPIYQAATDIAEIKDLLRTINTNTSPGNPFSGFPHRFAEDTIFNIAWEFITQKIVSMILAAFVAIPLVRTVLTFLKELFKIRRKDRSSTLQSNSSNKLDMPINSSTQNKPDIHTQGIPVPDRQENATPGMSKSTKTRGKENISSDNGGSSWGDIIRLSISFINILALFLVFFILLSFAFAPQFTSLSQPLEVKPVTEIQASTSAFTPSPTIPTQPVFTPVPPPTDEEKNTEAVTMLFVSEAMGIGILLFFVFFATLLAKKQTKIYDFKFPKVNLSEIGPLLLPAGFLALILLLLPYPVDSILMPLLIPFFIFAFFEVVQIYPNLYIKNLVVTHYSKIIFGAEFGVWYGFLSVLQNYSYPFWYIFRNSWEDIISRVIQNQVSNLSSSELVLNSRMVTDFIHSLPNTLPTFLWEVIPLILSIVLAIGPWRAIRDFSKVKHIEKIKKSM